MNLVWMATPDRHGLKNKQRVVIKANQLIQKRKQLVNAEDTGLQLTSLNTLINVQKHAECWKLHMLPNGERPWTVKKKEKYSKDPRAA